MAVVNTVKTSILRQLTMFCLDGREPYYRQQYRIRFEWDTPLRWLEVRRHLHHTLSEVFLKKMYHFLGKVAFSSPYLSRRL